MVHCLRTYVEDFTLKAKPKTFTIEDTTEVDIIKPNGYD